MVEKSGVAPPGDLSIDGDWVDNPDGLSAGVSAGRAGGAQI